MQNYHKHTCFSNIFVPDSAATYEDYAKRAVELGHKIISSVEHGWQSNYWRAYEAAKKHNLKFVFGTEAYWVRDRIKEYPELDKDGNQKTNKDGSIKTVRDRQNRHIVILARNENGRQAINDILSEANITGYYFRPRVDLELLLSLPANDVFITTACIAFRGKEDADDVILKLHEHFGDNFMLEIQNHLTEEQVNWNKHLLELSQKHGIEMIVGLDSHYIYPEDSALRDYILAAKGLHYEDEDGWFMDYPDDETVVQRFLEQGVFTKEQIQRAMDNTDICLEFEDYDDNIIFQPVIKLPTLYPDKTKEEKDKIYSRFITSKFKEYMKDIPKEEYDRYFEGVKSEVQTYKDTGMVDYPLIDYEIVKRAVEKGGLITDTGRGSAVGYFTNTLCGFSKVDRFTSAIKLYPERFISTSRILESNSLPDIDLNVGNVEIFEEAQAEIMGEEHTAPMIAFGTLKKKSAFKLYAKAKGMDFELANEISDQIGKYDEALKYADDDEKDDIDIKDYVDEKYHSYLEESEPYWGIVSDKKKAPSAYLLYQGNIRKEIGLVKCKSESTKKEVITTVMDGAVAENYKFLKNDLLKVDVVLLIAKVFDRIGIEHFNVNKLLQLIKTDDKVWDLYANGHTLCLNQVEKESTTKKVKKYKPHNVSELSAFIAAIRPGFKSMYKTFESRVDFSYDIPAFDNILRTEELPYSYMIFQEQVMNTLNYAGFPIDQCYGIIKAIAKKHPEKVRPLKSQFIDGFAKRIIEDDGMDKDSAYEASQKVWTIINDNCAYGFNSAHAYCMALDSLYQAWQKANYPFEFYEVVLQHYSDKGNKDKVALLKQEMTKAFGIQEGEFKWGNDNRRFVADKEKSVIYPSLLSLKGLSQKSADDLYALSQKKTYDNFYELFKDLKKVKSINSGKISTLVQIGYFKDFGSIGKIEKFLKCCDDLEGRSQFSKTKVDSTYKKYIEKYSDQTEKQFTRFDYESALKEIWNDLDDEEVPLNKRLKYELDCLGYVKTVNGNIKPEYAFVQGYECKFKNPKLTLYRICNGDIDVVKVKRAQYDVSPIEVGDIIKTIECSNEGIWRHEGKDENGKDIWKQDKNDLETILKKWTFVR